MITQTIFLFFNIECEFHSLYFLQNSQVQYIFRLSVVHLHMWNKFYCILIFHSWYAFSIAVFPLSITNIYFTGGKKLLLLITMVQVIFNRLSLNIFLYYFHMIPQSTYPK